MNNDTMPGLETRDLSEIRENKEMLEVSSDELDMMMNPEKYMELEIQKIEAEEKARCEEEDRINGKPLDIQTYNLIMAEREVRLSSRIEQCREKWAGMKGYT